MGIYLTLAACIVNFGLISGQPNQTENKAVSRQVEKQGKFENFFLWIRNEDTNYGGKYHDILKQEVARERQVFDAMKEELWNAQNEYLNKRKNFHEKNEKILAKKREIDADDEGSVDPDAYEDTVEENVTSKEGNFYSELGFDLKMGLCEPIISGVKIHFAQSLKRKIGASEDELHKEMLQVFVNMLKMTQFPVEYIDESDLLLTTDNILHIFEIKFGVDSDEKPNFRCNEKHLPSFLRRGKDVVCWGVSLLTKSDRPGGVVGEWKAEIFTEEGKLERSVAEFRYGPGSNTFED